MDVADLLRKVDLPSLRGFAGETIIKAIESVRPANYEGQLSEILKLKYGNDILNVKAISYGGKTPLDFCIYLKQSSK